MAAVPLVARSHLRRHRGASTLIGALIAVAVAVVLGALAGARRTDAAVGAFVAADQGSDGYAFFALPAFGGSASTDLAAEEALVGAVPGVVRTARFTDAEAQLSAPGIPGGRLAVQGYIGMEPDGISMVSQLRLVAGRHADQSRAGEVLIDEELARDADLGVGSAVGLQVYTAAQAFGDLTAGAEGVAVDAEVVGIVRRPTDLRDPQDRQLVANDYVVHQDVYLTSALWDAADGDIARYNPLVGFDVADDADLGQILTTMEEDLGAYAVAHDRFLELDGTFKGADRGANLHSTGLRIFAVVVAIAGLFLVGQTLGRQIVLEAMDNPTLRALGMTPRQLWQSALLRAAPVAVGGAVLGVVGAIALSPLAPLPGTVARRAELDLGVAVDAVVVMGGGLLAAVLVLVASALPSARAATSGASGDAAPTRPTLASRLATFGLAAPAVVGLRFALEPGRGRSAVPVRAAIAAAITAIAVVVGATSFSSSLSESRGDASRYGVTWDVAAGAMTTPEESVALADEIRSIPGVEAFAGMGNTAFDTPYGEVPALMLRQEQGVVTPSITDGRAPGPGEVALGALTMREAGLSIGDVFQIDDAIAGTRDFEITGTVVLNAAGVDPSIPPGRGALFDWSMLALLDPASAEFVAPVMFLVDVEPGRTVEVEERLRTLFPTSTRSAPVEPLDLVNLGDASLLPSALGVVVAVLGLGTVVHAMLSAIRRRQRELAVLKTMGFVRSQTRRAVVYQAITFGTLALIVGVPLGVAGGRTAWSFAASQLGIPSRPVTSIATIALVVGSLLGVLIITALVPAQLASRVPPAVALRRD